MLKSFIQYIVGMAEPHIQEIDGETYSDKQLHRIQHIPYAREISMNTLSSLIEYIKSGVDTFGGKMIIHVQSPTQVSMYSALDVERNREEIVTVNAQIPNFDFGRFMDHENFCIGVQSKFVDEPLTDKALLLKFAGTVEAGSVAEYGDDGISQKATVKTGIASKGDAIIPSPARLKPFRTFVEVDQPVSSFIFRMKDDRCGGVQCALFEADGGAWKISAMGAIKAYLIKELEDFSESFIIIS
jgi:hypothetical protein